MPAGLASRPWCRRRRPNGWSRAACPPRRWSPRCWSPNMPGISRSIGRSRCWPPRAWRLNVRCWRFGAAMRLLNSSRSIGVRSSSLIECLGDACLDWLASLSRDLLNERAKLLILRGYDIELLAHLRCRQLNKLRRALHTQQFMGVVKGGARVGAGNLDKLEIVVCGPLGNGCIGILEQVGCFLAGHLRLRVGILGMRDA